MKKKRKLGRKLLSFLLTLAMVMGLVPGMSLTAYAADVPYASLKNTTSVINFDGKEWYLIDYDASTVTLLSKECVGASKFKPNEGDIYTYSGSIVESFVNNWYADNISADAKAAVNGSGMFLLTKEQAQAITNTEVLKCTQASGAYSNHWWLCSPGTTVSSAMLVSGTNGNVSAGNDWIAYGVRPALKLDLSKVTFDSDTNTFTVDEAQTQTHTHDGITFKPWTSTDSLPITDGNYYLTEDVTMSKTWEVGEKITITLCLNGHGITANHNDSPINVAYSRDGEGGNLTLVDDDGEGTHYYYIDENGRGHIVNQDDEKYKNASNDKKGSFTGGYITVADNKSGIYSNGIVEIMNYASFTMKGGTIIGGTARGVEINTSSFTMSAGNIIGNTGGGVLVNYSSSVFNMEGGVISYNNQYGVNNCGTFKVSGNPTITENKNSDGACNVLVKNNNVITIGGTLTDKTLIGVTMDQPGVFTSSSNNVKAKDYAAQFKSDSNSYTVKVEGDELKLAPSQEHDKANAVAATVTANNRTYDGTEKPLVTADNSTLVGGTMQYAIGTSATTVPTTGWSDKVPTATAVGTYYVWYKAVGDADHSDTEAKCLTVKISQKSSGGGGSYTPSTPSTPTTPSSTSAPAPATPTVTTVPSSTAAPTEDYTVPVTNENAVNVSTSITEGNAVVNEITQSDIDKIVNKNSEPGTEADKNTSITIDVSKAKSEVTSIELTKTTIERLADTTSEQNNSVDTVTVQMTNAKVELDAKTLAAVSEQAAGKNIRLVVDDKLKQASLNEKQRDVISTYEKATTFEAYFESDGKRIHDFKGGTAKVSVRYSLVSGLLARFIHMLYLNPTGEVERFTTTYDGEWCTGELPHFSEYAIVYDTSVSNKTGTEEDAAEAERIAKDPYSGLDPEDWNADKNDFVADETTILPNGKTAYENGLAINSGLRLIQKGKTLTVTWGKVKGATGYKIYAEYCGTKMPDTPIKTIKSGSKVKVVIKELHGKKLNKKKNYKVCVVAYKTVNGVDKVLGRTVTAHVVGAKNKKYSNPKKLTIVSKTKLSLKTGKSAKIISKVTLVNKKRKSLSDAHAPMFRYASTNKKVVTVNKKGKIKAVGKGQCYIWVYAKNGYGKKVKVTVS